MQIHNIKPIHKLNIEKKRIGRGGKKGWTSGKGSKGQKSRTSHRFQPLIRQMIKKYPKLRGSRAKTMPESVIAVNLEVLEKHFKPGEIVSPEILLEKDIVSFPGKKVPTVKILGKGELTKSLVFKNCLFSKSAREKAEKAGGKIQQ